MCHSGRGRRAPALYDGPVTDLPAHLARYHRQAILPGIGPEGQARLAASHAAIVGVGALGSVIVDLLSRAGVGTLTIIDRDVVELTNLQRQVLYDEDDAREGLPKVEAAARRLRRVNSACRVFAEAEDLRPGPAGDAERVLGVLGDPAARPGVIVDGTDNFATRYLLNDVCVKHGVALVYGGAVGSGGTQTTFVPGVTPCLRCLQPAPPAAGEIETCDTAGVLAMTTTIVAACQATDALKVLLGRADLLSGTLLSLDLWTNQRRRVDLRGARDADCPCCARRVFEFLDHDDEGQARVLCGRNSVQVGGREAGRSVPGAARALRDGGANTPCESKSADDDSAAALATLATLADRLKQAGLEGVSHAGSSVRARTIHAGIPLTLTVFADGRTIVSGTTDVSVARSVCAKYVGT